MKTANVELAIEKLLKFMQNEMEQHGGNIAQTYFNFSPKFTQYFLNAEPEEVIEGKELTNFRKRSKLTDDVINHAIRACLSRRYVKQRHYYPGLKNEHMGDKTIILKLTDDGYTTARYSDVEIDEEEEVIVREVPDDTKYTAEKIKGANKKNEKTNNIKFYVIKPIFMAKKKESPNRKTSEISISILKEMRDLSESKFEVFAAKYSIADISHLKDALNYIESKEDGGQVTDWCYEILQGKW